MSAHTYAGDGRGRGAPREARERSDRYADGRYADGRYADGPEGEGEVEREDFEELVPLGGAFLESVRDISLSLSLSLSLGSYLLHTPCMHTPRVGCTSGMHE